MKKSSIILTYREEPRKQRYLDALCEADPTDLRILMALELFADCEDAPTAVCELLGLEEAAFEASVKFWRGAGMISMGTPKKSAAAPKLPSAHKDGKRESRSELPSYTTQELTALIERRRITAEFVDEAQRVLGKMFNTHEVSILVALVDYVGLEEEAVLVLLSHMAKMGKRSMHYIEKTAFGLVDEGIVKAKDLQEHLQRIDESREVEKQVRALFGMNGRELTTKEKNYLKRWVEKLGFGIDVIRMAYEITVDNTHEAAPAYANSILENWHKEGLRTVPEIRAYLAKREADRKGSSDSSFNTDEFFDAALNRTFGEFLK